MRLSFSCWLGFLQASRLCSQSLATWLSSNITTYYFKGRSKSYDFHSDCPLDLLFDSSDGMSTSTKSMLISILVEIKSNNPSSICRIPSPLPCNITFHESDSTLFLTYSIDQQLLTGSTNIQGQGLQKNLSHYPSQNSTYHKCKLNFVQSSSETIWMTSLINPFGVGIKIQFLVSISQMRLGKCCKNGRIFCICFILHCSFFLLLVFNADVMSEFSRFTFYLHG